MADWKRNLRRAAFRGVRFHTAERGFTSGRRVQNHEFPKRNSNFPEDMGKATREFSVDAYVIGDDYMAARNRLIAACEREGAGQYVDHWGLSQRVVCTSVSVIETSEDGRFCRLQLDFLEAGGSQGLVAIPATVPNLIDAARRLSTAVQSFYSGNALR